MLPKKRAHPADGGGALARPLEAERAVGLPDHARRRQEGLQDRPDADGTRAGSAAAVGRGERLVHVEVHHVEAGLARPEPAHDRVEVRAVHVGEGAGRVGRLEQLPDPPLEQPQRRRVGDHDRGGPGAQRRLEGVDVHAAVGRRRDRDRAEAGHGRGGRVGAVGRVRDEDLVARHVAARAMVGADHQDPGELAVGAGRGLERDRVHAADLGEHPLELPEELERALGGRVGRQRVQVREARQARGPLVELGVVLHGARAQRVEARVHRVVELGQVHEVTGHLGLGELGQRRRSGAPRGGRDPVEGARRRVRDLAAAAPGGAALEDGLLEPLADDAHAAPPVPAAASSAARAAANRAISSLVVTSVAHTSRPSARDGSSGSRSAVGMPARMPRSRSRAWTARAPGTRTTSSLRYGASWSRGCSGCREGGDQLRGARRAGGRHVAQPVRADRGQVDGRREREQRLVGADVGRRLLAADVLLAGPHRHHEGALPVEVRRHAHETARDLADQRIRAGDDPEVGAAVAQRDAQRLALAGGDVGAVLGGRREDGERDGLDDRHEQGARGVREASDLGHVLEEAQDVGLGRDDAGDGTTGIGQQSLECREVRRARQGPLGEDRDLVDGQARALGVGLQRRPVVRMDGARDEDPLAPRGAAGHQRRLGRRRPAVVVRGGDDVEAGELGQQRLVLVDALERPLGDLGLVRRVGRVPLAAEQHLVHDGRRPVAVGAGAEERGEVHAVAGRHRLQPGGEQELGLGLVEGQRAGPQTRAGCPRTGRRPNRCRSPRASVPDRRPRAGRTAWVRPR